MKKILLATSILAGSAGVAMAGEVSFSGNAHMGLSNNWDNEITGGPLSDYYSDFEFVSRVRFKMTATGDTDSGLTWGFAVETQNVVSAGSNSGSDENGSSTVWIEGEFGKITFGDVGDASDNLIGNVDGVGMNLDGHTYNELGYVGNDKTAVKYERTFGDLSLTVGLGQLDANNDGDEDQDMSIAAKYSFGDYAVYAGYSDHNTAGANVTEATLGADATFGNFTVKARAQDNSDESDMTWAISGTGKFDAISVTAYYAQHDTFSAVGIGGSYDLGGGASFVMGVAQADYDTPVALATIADPAATTQSDTEETLIDVGLKFSF